MAKNCGEAAVKAARKAKEFDSEHVGLRTAYQKTPELGIAATASDLSGKVKAAGGSLAGRAQPLVEKAKTASGTLAERWKGFDERNQVTVLTPHLPPRPPPPRQRGRGADPMIFISHPKIVDRWSVLKD